MLDERLYNKQTVVRWKVVAGGELTEIQKYDVLFDEKDYEIRQLEKRPRIVL